MLTEEPAKTEEQKSAEEFAKEWAGWKITPEQLDRIRAKDREACNAFYLDNLPRLKKLAIGYAYQKKSLYGFGNFFDVDEMLQCLFWDLPYLSWNSQRDFKSSLHNHSFYFVPLNGYYYVRENKVRLLSHKEERELPRFIVDEPIPCELDDADVYVIDLYAFNPSVTEEIAEDEENKRLGTLEDDLPAFLRGLFREKEYIAWMEGKHPKKAVDTLKEHYKEVVSFLAAHGTPRNRLQGTPESEEERKEKLAKRKAHLLWEEEHLDQLPPARRRSVLARISLRNARHEKRDNAKAEKTRATL